MSWFYLSIYFKISKAYNPDSDGTFYGLLFATHNTIFNSSNSRYWNKIS